MREPQKPRLQKTIVGEVTVEQLSNHFASKRRTALGALLLASSLYGACTEDDPDLPAGPGVGSMPGPSTAGDAAAGLGGGATTGGAPNIDGGVVSMPGTGGGTFGGGTTTGGVTGGTAAAGGMTAGTMPMGSHDHCKDGYPADPRDSMITSKPDEWKATNGDIDLVLPKAVVTWMQENVWEKSHDAWHNIRRCGSGGFGGAAGGGFIGGLFGGGGAAGGGAGGVDVCAQTDLVPADQECENASDGYQFLVMHRHMMQALRQAFPTHKDLFDGFQHFPFQASDVPEQWRSRWRPWAQQILDMANRLEAIEQNLGSEDFATEGDLGKYIQCGAGAFGANSVHGAMHFTWQVPRAPHALGDQTVNIDNYMFWKLHGWIDNIWERYRVAKGLKPDEPKLKQALYDQCYEMHQLGHLFDSSVNPPMSTEPLPAERGYFHESVRPILDKYCASCHSGTRPQSNLLLGGQQVTSAAIVQNLVGVPTVAGGQFKRVLAGNADQSWLYVKVAGSANAAGCNGTCNTGVMPPVGEVTLTAAELAVIRKWITDGAPAPTQ